MCSSDLRAFRGSTCQTVKSPRVGLKWIVGPVGLTVSARLFGNVAYCHLDVNNNAPEEFPIKETVPEFSWDVLWEFVKPQLLALIGAVVVSSMTQTACHSVDDILFKINHSLSYFDMNKLPRRPTR